MARLTSPPGQGQIGLLGAGGRGGLPFPGVVHDAAHLGEPPVGALDTAVAGGAATVAAGQAEFELVVVNEFNFLCWHNVCFVCGGQPIFGPGREAPFPLPLRPPQIGFLPVMRMTLRNEVGQWLSN